mgnify:CR=1 FL=1
MLFRSTQPPILRDMAILRESNLLGSLNSNSTWVCNSKILEDRNFMNPIYKSIDWATTLQLDPLYRCAFIDQRLYSYRKHPLQITRSYFYIDSAFNEIYPLWHRLNSQIGLPNLSLDQTRVIAAPWSRGENAFSIPLHWAKSFLRLPQIRNSPDYGSLRLIILNRIHQFIYYKIRYSN